MNTNVIYQIKELGELLYLMCRAPSAENLIDDEILIDMELLISKVRLFNIFIKAEDTYSLFHELLPSIHMYPYISPKDLSVRELIRLVATALTTIEVWIEKFNDNEANSININNNQFTVSNYTILIDIVDRVLKINSCLNNRLSNIDKAKILGISYD